MAGLLDNVEVAKRTTREFAGFVPNPNSTRDIITGLPTNRIGTTGGMFVAGYNDLVDPVYKNVTRIDQPTTFGRAAGTYQGAADDAMAGAVDAAGGALRTAQSTGGRLNIFADEAANAASGMSRDIGATRDAAAGVRGAAHELTPFVGQLNTFGNTLFTQGQDLYGTGMGFIEQANDILGLNKDASGFAGQFVKALMAIDPDRYVASAAGDVQTAYSNLQEQMQRNLARQGQDASSGRSQALTHAWAQAAASAVAGAKTRARQLGLTERLAALGQGSTVAGNIAQVGSGLTGQGVQASATGGQLVQGAANVQATKGQLLSSAGQLEGQAGQLGASQANAFTAAGQMSSRGAELEVNAAQALAQAQNNAAMYYAQVAQGFGALAGSGGLAKALFG